MNNNNKNPITTQYLNFQKVNQNTPKKKKDNFFFQNYPSQNEKKYLQKNQAKYSVKLKLFSKKEKIKKSVLDKVAQLSKVIYPSFSHFDWDRLENSVILCT